MKNPEDCKNLSEIREEIDAIDEEIISMLGKRLLYVKVAARFKSKVKVPERIRQMLVTRKKWAQQKSLDSSEIIKIYKDLLNYFSKEQEKLIKKK